MIRARVLVGLLLAASSVGCGAILGFPDQTSTDPNFGLGDGGVLPDGFVLEGGPQPDAAGTDGAIPIPDAGPPDAPVVLPDGGCNCFGGTCNNGVCQPVEIATELNDPFVMDTDNTTLWFADTVHTLDAIDLTAAKPTVATLSMTESNLNDLKAAPGYVYFANNPQGNTNGVSRCSNKNCVNRLEYAASANLNFGVAVDSAKVYYTVNQAASGAGGVWSCPLTGCPGGVGATRIEKRDFPMLIATDGVSVGWFEGNAGTGVVQSGVGGGAVSSSNTNSVVGLSYAANGDVYFVTGGGLFFVPKGSTAAQQIGFGAGIKAVRVDNASGKVYWLQGGNPGSIVRCSLAMHSTCASPEKLVINLPAPQAFTVSSDSLLYSTLEATGGAIWRLKL